MKKLLLLHACTFLLVYSSPAQSEGETTADEKALRHIKEVLWPQAYREQDVQLLDELLADEFQMIDGEGNWFSKKDELEYVSKNKPSYDAFRFVIKRLEVFENGTAVVAGKGIINGKNEEGIAYIYEYQSSNILIKRGGKWKAISSHVSGGKEIN